MPRRKKARKKTESNAVNLNSEIYSLIDEMSNSTDVNFNSAVERLYGIAAGIRFEEIRAGQFDDVASSNAISEIFPLHKLNQLNQEQLDNVLKHCVRFQLKASSFIVQNPANETFTFSSFCKKAAERVAEQLVLKEKNKKGNEISDKDILIKEKIASVINKIGVEEDKKRSLENKSNQQVDNEQKIIIDFPQRKELYEEIAKNTLPSLLKYLKMIENKLQDKLRKLHAPKKASQDSKKELQALKNKFVEIKKMCMENANLIIKVQSQIKAINEANIKNVAENISTLSGNLDKVVLDMGFSLEEYEKNRNKTGRFNFLNNVFEKFCDKVRELIRKERYASTKFILEKASTKIDDSLEKLRSSLEKHGMFAVSSNNKEPNTAKKKQNSHRVKK